MGIAEWLASLGLGGYTQAFRNNHIEFNRRIARRTCSRYTPSAGKR
jgi:hypothetical protein